MQHTHQCNSVKYNQHTSNINFFRDYSLISHPYQYFLFQSNDPLYSVVLRGSSFLRSSWRPRLWDLDRLPPLDDVWVDLGE